MDWGVLQARMGQGGSRDRLEHPPSQEGAGRVRGWIGVSSKYGRLWKRIGVSSKPGRIQGWIGVSPEPGWLWGCP